MTDISRDEVVGPDDARLLEPVWLADQASAKLPYGAVAEYFVPGVSNGRMTAIPVSWLPSAIGDAVKKILALRAALDKSEAALAAEKQRADDAEAGLALLSDPAAVHVNMLRGTIAKPTWAQIKHIYTAEVEAGSARAVEVERERCAAIADEYDGAGMEIDLHRQDGDAYRTRSDIAAAIRAQVPK